MVCLVGRLVRLDLGCLRFHGLPADHGADLSRIRRAIERSCLCADADLVDASAGRRRLGLARRPGRAKDPADDLDPRLLALQLHRRVLADAAVSVDIPRIARDLYGSGVASRGGLGDGELADPFPRFHERGSTGIVGIGFALSSLIWGLFVGYIGWRGMLWIGVLPALSVFYVRRYVKEPEIWVENRRLQRTQNREVHVPLLSIFKRGLLYNTLTACWWMASNFILYYSLTALFVPHLQKDLNLSPTVAFWPVLFFNLVGFVAMGFWGWTGDKLGRRWSMIIPAAIAVPIAPLYLLTADFSWIFVGYVLQGAFGGALYSQLPSYLSERFPTEVRATASAFCYHQGAIFGGLVPLVLTFFAEYYQVGLVIPMLVGTVAAAISVVIALLISPETKGTVLVAELQVA